MWGGCILLNGNHSSTNCPRVQIPRKCVNHGQKLYALIPLCQQRSHFVSNDSAVRISAKEVRPMRLFIHDQLNIMCGKFTYCAPVLTDCCWIGEAQSVKGDQILERWWNNFSDNYKVTLLFKWLETAPFDDLRIVGFKTYWNDSIEVYSILKW